MNSKANKHLQQLYKIKYLAMHLKKNLFQTSKKIRTSGDAYCAHVLED